ncbi:class F sortase [Streptomyces sp. FXJ1.172]|uniref:class F sortase n=1 Tax=Streptomyces sp. FXJ1.172 TaxID=710705 RepID=UPI0007D02A04|nr:class F sortase [Streptomyces sp. FXJ1.172]WEO99350.1 class F sortase [Streptomyces sp. FXJ1.172]
MAADSSSPNSGDTQPGEHSSGRGGRLTLWIVAIVVLFVSVLGSHHRMGDAPQTSRAAGAGAGAGAGPGAGPGTGASTGTGTGTGAGAGAAATADPQREGPELPRSAPTRLLIPKIDVDAPFTTLAIGAGNRLQPPPADDTNLVGWYSKGVSPGEKGTAIIAGHVDTTTSAAVFANLDELKSGDEFTVRRADGRDADFVVDDAEKFAKDAFPDKRVYGNASRPEVRLITCAGPYDHEAKDYTDNLVVFAHLV